MFPGSYYPPSYFPSLYYPGSQSALRGNYFPHSYFTEKYYPDLYFPGDATVLAPIPPHPPAEEPTAIGGLFRYGRRIPRIRGFAHFTLPLPSLDALGVVLPGSIHATFSGQLPDLAFSASGQATAAAIAGDWTFSLPVVELSAQGSVARKQGKRSDVSDDDEQLLMEHYMFTLKWK